MGMGTPSGPSPIFLGKLLWPGEVTITLRWIGHRVKNGWKFRVTAYGPFKHEYYSQDAYFVTASLISIAFFLWYASRLRRTAILLPPGPPGLPVLGNLLSVHQFTHRGLAKLSKIHGGFFHLRVGQPNVFVVSSPETVREIIHENDSVFSHCPVTAAMVYVSYDLADMAFAHYGPFWRQMRKLCVLKLFSPRRDVSWRVVRGEVDALVRSVAELRRVAGSVGDLVFKFATNVTFRAAFGAQSREDEKVFVDIILELSEIFMAFNMGDYIPCLGWLDLNGIGKRMAAARHALDVFIDRIIDEHLAKLRNGDVSASDMVDDMIAYLVDAPGGRHKRADGVELGDLHLTRDNIKGLIMARNDIMFGGTKTVASTVEWALSELLRNPDELKRAQDELAGVVGLRRRVNQDDLDNLPHLRCVTKEAMCRDEALWGTDAAAFRPSRFADESARVEFKGGDFQYLPFGSGRRSCPGMQLGMFAVELGLAELLHCFDWSLPAGTEPLELDMDDVFGLTAPKAERLCAVPSPRLSCPLL
ncbi:Os06g0349700 [Oryza sativa Japonica Group]|uniref:Ferulate-5-hydroxylase n=2 Tax=Oryza sativa subsp. japonica TaxID=39947 RepID=A1IGU8_ORYSJ|nr:ferulate-5-hydroxylase [Oryza sativa Japonica Group]BAH93502.1 Os06g0349700 [Oryza sativa Japonica Group]BAS97665.1 Os06g0349700 [Oryza sativa Japonica Group]|eukprot:NP_001174774.1 Os06g0349700 [Oryza sativa Japonica Group]